MRNKLLLLALALTSCATPAPEEKMDIATVSKVLNCDFDEEYKWCVLVLEDGRTAGTPTWDINVGDRVICEERGILTCFRVIR